MQTDLMKILGKQAVPSDYFDDIYEIYTNCINRGVLVMATMAFNYGVIIGTRRERQSRKKKTLAQSANRTRENKGI